jgi:hypothetical protein
MILYGFISDTCTSIHSVHLNVTMEPVTSWRSLLLFSVEYRDVYVPCTSRYSNEKRSRDVYVPCTSRLNIEMCTERTHLDNQPNIEMCTFRGSLAL